MYLEKAFDSIEYDDLLNNIGINGKCWRLIRHWYTNVIKLEDEYSKLFTINRGVKQGSVLSPTLFSIVIDSLLKHLDAIYCSASRVYG